MDNNDKIQQIQFMEQNIQNLFMQKQAFQMELSESQSAIKEIENSDEEIFKIVGQLMIKTDKKKTKEELSNKERILKLRIKTIEKQEVSLTEKMENLRKEVIKQ